MRVILPSNCCQRSSIPRCFYSVRSFSLLLLNIPAPKIPAPVCGRGERGMREPGCVSCVCCLAMRHGREQPATMCSWSGGRTRAQPTLPQSKKRMTATPKTRGPRCVLASAGIKPLKSRLTRFCPGASPRAFLPRPPSQSCGNQRPSVRVIARSSLRKSHSPGAGACSYRNPTPQAPWAQRGRLIGFLWYAS